MTGVPRADGATDAPRPGTSVRTEPPAAAPAVSLRLLLAVAGVAIVVLFVLTQVVSPQHVSGRSMSPTLADGDVVLVDRVTTRFRAPQRNDVVLVSQDGEELVKRVVAVGGQLVGLENGSLTVDGTILDEPWIDEAALVSTYYGPFVVPDGTVFVMGDNRAESVDSRVFGPVPLDQVVGLVRLRLLPPSTVPTS